MVGLDDHLSKMVSLLDLDHDEAKIVGISGPAGIGKSTIARALHSMLSNRFQHTCFMDNLRENYKVGLVDYGMKLRLQEKLLSELLNLNGIWISHSGVIQERLHDQKVLIILDDVESLDQLEALANTMWFGPGSRVIVTTEKKEVLQQHGISDSDIYHVGFPSSKEALMIFCQSAFRQISPPHGFRNLAVGVTEICGNLPLALHVLGSSLQGKNYADWIDELPRLQTCLDGRIESVLKVGYDSLHEKDQALFLYIAVFFNHKHVDYVKTMLAKTNMDVRLGLKILANRHLIHIGHGPKSIVVVHRLLQVMARQVISKQEPWKRQILVDTQEIFYVLENGEGNGSIVGISFNVGEINKLTISTRAFERMHNLFFLKVYDPWVTGKNQLHIPEELDYLPRLRLLHWDAYPRKTLPHRFCPANLVELDMASSKPEALWDGTQPLANLKKMNLARSYSLKKLPDLTNATNLERLDLYECIALVELPFSLSNLRILNYLETNNCRSLEIIPTLVNLAFLKEIKMMGCTRLRSFPDVPTNIDTLSVMETTVKECPASLRDLSHLKSFDISGSVNLKTFSIHLPTSVTELHLDHCGIESITDCIKGLHNLRVLALTYCKKLTSLPKLPGSLEWLRANHCKSLESVSGPLKPPNAELDFSNCFKLGRQARRAITQEGFVSGRALLPGRKVPTEFQHRARGNKLTIPHSDFYRFKVCIVISKEFDHKTRDSTIVSRLLCRCTVGNSVNSTDMKFVLNDVYKYRMEHLFVFHILDIYPLPFFNPSSREIVLEFSSICQDFDIIECGVQILTEETDGNNIEGSGDEDDDNDLLDTHESESSDKEERYITESVEVSKDKDEDIADDSGSESISKKHPRKRTLTSATTNLKKWILCFFLFLFLCSLLFLKFSTIFDLL